MDYTNVLDSYGAIIEEDLKSRLDEMVREGQKYHPSWEMFMMLPESLC